MRNRISAKHLFRLLLPALPLLFSGCFIIYHDNAYDPNTLVIQNDFDAVGDIWYAYITPSASATWGPDLLRGDMLQPGDELIVDVYNCNRYYDIRVEYDDGVGPMVEKYDIWLPCNTTTIVSFIDW
jgi:hypothetical protein